ARVLRREDEIGSLEPGKAADLVLFDLNDIGYAGAACHDPAAALLYCGTGQRVRTSIINGRVVVDDKRLVATDEGEIVRNANAYAKSLVAAANERYDIDFLAHPER
ncbi:MAG: amidohydrolase family protein, partial [Myxococcales bacterium]|nr:amidohydrolase family protein [Myxococcales bacterium]